MSGLNNIDEFNAQVKRTIDRLNGNPTSTPGANAEEQTTNIGDPGAVVSTNTKGKVSRGREGGSPLVPQKDQPTSTEAPPDSGKRGSATGDHGPPVNVSNTTQASGQAASPEKAPRDLTPRRGVNSATTAVSETPQTISSASPMQRVPGIAQHPAPLIAHEGLNRNTANSSPCKLYQIFPPAGDAAIAKPQCDAAYNVDASSGDFQACIAGLTLIPLLIGWMKRILVPNPSAPAHTKVVTNTGTILNRIEECSPDAIKSWLQARGYSVVPMTSMVVRPQALKPHPDHTGIAQENRPGVNATPPAALEGDTTANDTQGGVGGPAATVGIGLSNQVNDSTTNGPKPVKGPIAQTGEVWDLTGEDEEGVDNDKITVHKTIKFSDEGIEAHGLVSL